MIVFVTGATGVLGRPVVKRLVQNGHQVRALSRSTNNRDQLLAAGAIPLPADIFDPGSMSSAFRDCEAVLHLAARIPGVSEMKRPGIWDENDRVRTEGTRSIVKAAEASPNVRTLIYPSVSLFYGDGGAEWITAETAKSQPCEAHLSTLTAEDEVRRYTDGSPGRKGIILRFGSFYGPSSPDSVQTMMMAHRGVALPIAPAGTYKSMIWIDDAARAVIDALERAPGGTYDVVEDNPSTQREALEALAIAVDRKRLLKLPRVLLRTAVPADLRRMLLRSQRISNARFREATGWYPEITCQRIGWRLMRDVAVAGRQSADPGGHENPPEQMTAA